MTKVINGTNAQILNTVRKNASHAYQERIPAVSDADISKAVNELNKYTPFWSEFVETLLNVVGMRIFNINKFENRLKPFAGSMTYGGMVEEYAADLIEAEDYAVDDTNVFGAKHPEVQVNWHRINSRRRYSLKVTDDLLMEAVENEGGLANLVNMIMSKPTESAEWDLYLMMLELLGKYKDADGMANVHVSAVTDEATGKNLVKVVRSWYEKSKFYRTDTNAAGINALSTNMRLICSASTLASIDVDVLSAAFNMDKASFMGQVVAVDEWPASLAGTEAILMDADFFRVYNTKTTMRSIQNPADLSTVYYLHVWDIVSASRFVPCIRFSTDADNIEVATPKTVSSVAYDIMYEGDTASANKVEVKPGTVYDLVPKVTYSDTSTDGRAYFIIAAANSTAPGADAAEVALVKPDTGTYVGAGYRVVPGTDGRAWKLHVDDYATYDSISITCVAVGNTTKNTTKTINKPSSS